jgi:hypothetical protein
MSAMTSVKTFPYETLLKRDKVSLDIFWLKDESLEDSASLPDPDLIASEIAGVQMYNNPFDCPTE